MTAIGYLASELAAPSHTFIRREIAALRAHGVAVKAYSIRGQSADGKDDAILGKPPFEYFVAFLTELFRAPTRFFATWALSLRHRPRGLRNLVWSQFHFVEAIVLARMLRRDNCSHLHNHFANSGATVGLLAAKQTGISWSLTLHGISEIDYPAIVTLRDKLLAAEFVACASRFMMAQGMRLIDRRHWSKFLLVRCGIDRSQFPPIQASDREGPVRVLCVGRLSAEKGYFGLFEALASLRSQLPDFALRIVGDGPERASLAHDVSEKQLGNSVQFLGALPEMKTLEEIAACDFLVLPSLMEGLPVVLIEARALGKPVIAPAIAGIPEFVTHDVNGLMFGPADWPKLGSHFAALLSDEALRTRLANGSANQFLEEFDIDNVASTLAAKFESITAVKA